MCAVSRARAPRAELLRFVVSPGGQVVPDIREELPGRGLWLALSRATVEEAVRRKVFARNLQGVSETLPALADTVARLLLKDAMSALSLAAKAGQAVAGFDKVESVLRNGLTGVLIAAADGAEDGRRKLAGKLKASGSNSPIVECFGSADLDLALGRTNVIHAAIKSGGLARKFVTCAKRYEKFETYGAARAES